MYANMFACHVREHVTSVDAALYVINKEGLWPSRGDNNRLMMMNKIKRCSQLFLSTIEDHSGERYNGLENA
jgi:hypothetical protein